MKTGTAASSSSRNVSNDAEDKDTRLHRDLLFLQADAGNYYDSRLEVEDVASRSNSQSPACDGCRQLDCLCCHLHPDDKNPIPVITVESKTDAAVQKLHRMLTQLTKGAKNPDIRLVFIWFKDWECFHPGPCLYAVMINVTATRQYAATPLAHLCGSGCNGYARCRCTPCKKMDRKLRKGMPLLQILIKGRGHNDVTKQTWECLERNLTEIADFGMKNPCPQLGKWWRRSDECQSCDENCGKHGIWSIARFRSVEMSLSFCPEIKIGYCCECNLMHGSSRTLSFIESPKGDATRFWTPSSSRCSSAAQGTITPLGSGTSSLSSRRNLFGTESLAQEPVIPRSRSTSAGPSPLSAQPVTPVMRGTPQSALKRRTPYSDSFSALSLRRRVSEGCYDDDRRGTFSYISAVWPIVQEARESQQSQAHPSSAESAQTSWMDPYFELNDGDFDREFPRGPSPVPIIPPNSVVAAQGLRPSDLSSTPFQPISLRIEGANRLPGPWPVSDNGHGERERPNRAPVPMMRPAPERLETRESLPIAPPSQEQHPPLHLATNDLSAWTVGPINGAHRPEMKMPTAPLTSNPNACAATPGEPLKDYDEEELIDLLENTQWDSDEEY